MRFVLRQRKLRTPYLFPHEPQGCGAGGGQNGYGGFLPPVSPDERNEASIGCKRSRTLARRQQSASATIFASSSDSSRPARSRRSPRTTARNNLIESSN